MSEIIEAAFEASLGSVGELFVSEPKLGGGFFY